MIYFGLKPIAKFLRMKDALAFSSSSMSEVIKSLFANNEQGFAFDFNDLSTMFQDAAGTIPVTGVGQPVGKVLDKSGCGNHATQATSSKRPILQKNATTGAYYLYFDGVDDYLVITNLAGMPNPVTVFAATQSYKTATQVLISKTTSGYICHLSPTSMAIQDSPAIIANVAKAGIIITTAIYNTNGTTLRANKNVATTQNVRTGYSANGTLVIGAFNTSNSLSLQGDMYFLIEINRLATSTEIISIENAIAKNVGVTL